MTTNNKSPQVGYLLHLTHYDPGWNKRKDVETPFDPDVGRAVIDALRANGFDLLILGCSDGLVYESHPELARHYSIPKSIVAEVIAYARSRGLAVAPKLNFSQSAHHQHNHWFRPHNALFDSDEYWRLAFEVVDELIAMFSPSPFFHIGMDEDHDRSYTQYVEAIRTLHDGLATRGQRTMIWNDTAWHGPRAQIHREKALHAETRIPTDILQVYWDYWELHPEDLRRLVSLGFATWIAPGADPKLAAAWRREVVENGGGGLLLTHWTPCVAANRAALLQRIEALGPALTGTGATPDSVSTKLATKIPEA